MSARTDRQLHVASLLAALLASACALDWDHATDVREAGAEATQGEAGSEQLDAGEESTNEPDAAVDPQTSDPCSPRAMPDCGQHEDCRVVDGKAECACKAGYATCEGICQDTQTDPRHCGECGYRCAEGHACSMGTCEQKAHEMVLGFENTCALLASAGEQRYPLRCWGSGAYGLYRDATVMAKLPRRIADVETARGMAISPGRRCVIESGADTVTCWGTCGIDCGLLAGPSLHETLNRFEAGGVRTLSTVDGFNGVQFGGARYQGGATCLIDDAARLFCIGYPVFTTQSFEQRQLWQVAVSVVSHRPNFRDVSGHGYHTCGVEDSEEGRVACWGLPTMEKRLGAPSQCVDYTETLMCSPDGAAAVHVRKEVATTYGDYLAHAVSVSAGLMTSCAVVMEGPYGEVYCWGDNQTGLLGCGDAREHEGAVKVIGLADEDIVQVAAGDSLSCALARSGQVYCWGLRLVLGIGDDAPPGDAFGDQYFSTPQRLPDLRDALDLAVGGAHACARRRSGEVVCWGENSMGQLGDGTTRRRNTPAPVLELFEDTP